MRSVLTLATLLAWTTAAAAQPYRPPHNAYGQPDFEATWSFNSLTRLERAADIPGPVLSAADAARITPPPTFPVDAVGAHESEQNDAFNLGWARLGGEYRSSWLLDPADGRLPYSPAGEARLRPAVSDNPENRSNYERCLSPPQAGPPMLNATYNNNLTLLQTRDHVAIQLEANHEIRIIPLGKRARDPTAAPRWFGEPVAWYEGDTLVVETTRFAPSQSDRRSIMTRVFLSPDARVVERFTRISPTQIRYQFSVEDPALFTQTWRGEIPFTLTTEPTFEYACHEGNYGLENILAGARWEEQAKP